MFRNEMPPSLKKYSARIDSSISTEPASV
jgi:hypothetical protein